MPLDHPLFIDSLVVITFNTEVASLFTKIIHKVFQ
jgi:hypothetical protein